MGAVPDRGHGRRIIAGRDRLFVDTCLELALQQKLDTATASMGKY